MSVFKTVSIYEFKIQLTTSVIILFLNACKVDGNRKIRKQGAHRFLCLFFVTKQ